MGKGKLKRKGVTVLNYANWARGITPEYYYMKNTIYGLECFKPYYESEIQFGTQRTRDIGLPVLDCLTSGVYSIPSLLKTCHLSKDPPGDCSDPLTLLQATSGGV